VEACLPKDATGNFIPGTRAFGRGSRYADLPGRADAGDEQAKAAGDQGLSGLAGGLRGAREEDLSPKTKLQSYYEHDYESFLAVLKKNKKKLAVDPARREPAEAIAAEFQGSVGKLTPLRCGSD
jgi:hypothetical protein